MPNQKRKLAAIMFSDIVGYTDMMQKDELDGLNKAKRYRKELRQLVSIYEGEILQHYGDGSLTIFSSAVNAMMCAQNLQISLKAQLATQGEIKEVPLRIGLHVGDIIIEDDDIFGNGVNIASRLESLGQPGTILFSQSIYEKIQTLPEFQVTSLGSFHFKNVREPMEVFALSNEQMVVPKPESIIGKLQELKPNDHRPVIRKKWAVGFSLIVLLIVTGILSWDTIFRNLFMDERQRTLESVRSVAVMPFNNFTGDDSLAHWMSGMHDDLSSKIGQLGALRVTSTRSTLAYANSQKNSQDIASELNVDALVEISVKEFGDSIKLQLKLIKAFPEEEQLWLLSFDIVKSDISNLYSEIAIDIASEINLKLSPLEEVLLGKSQTVNPEVYEAYYNGKFNMGFLTQEGQNAAIDYFSKAIEIDPDFAPAHAGLGGVWGFLKQMDYATSDVADPKIEEHLNRALALDSTLADVYYYQAIKKVWKDFDWEGGERAFKQSINLQPNFSESKALYSHFLMCLNKWDEAWEQMNEALMVDPNNPFVQVLSSVLLENQEKYVMAIEKLEPLEQKMPNNPLITHILLISYAKMEQHEKAVHQVKKHMHQIGFDWVINTLDEAYQERGFKYAINHTANILSQSSDTVFVPSQTLFTLFALAENREMTLHWVERNYIRRDPTMPYIAVFCILKPYHNEPRFIDIVKSMDLKLDN
jgi:adenylate cyclase